jgi:hypothetical protein
MTLEPAFTRGYCPCPAFSGRQFVEKNHIIGACSKTRLVRTFGPMDKLRTEVRAD